LNDLPQAWLDAIAFFVLCQDSSGKSLRTVRNRRGAIAAMARATGTGSPAEVTRQAAVTYIAADRKRRKTADGAASHFKCLSSFWSWWSAEENLPNPMAGLPRPKTDGNTPIPVLSDEQLAAVYGAMVGRSMPELRDRAILLLFLASGIRLAELVALSVADVDIRAGEAVIRRGKGGKFRTVTFGPDTKMALTRYVAARGKYLAARRRESEQAMFIARTCTRLTDYGVSEMLARRGKQAGVEGVRAHLFRHRWAHCALASGMGESNIIRLGGWSTGNELRRYGAALADERAREAGHANPLDTFRRSR